METLVPIAAHRKASFWHKISPLTLFKSTGTIEPGYGAANATSFLPVPWLVK